MDNLVLVGFSCSGKTTVGRSLARRLRLRFVDTDRLIEEATGRTIPEIFEEDGEAAFREMERQTIAHVCSCQGQVISTGGGAFVDPENRELLRDQNLVIHLQVQPETVIERLQTSKSGRPRPLLQTDNPLQRVRDLMQARKGAYTRAHVSLSVDERTRHDVVAEISRRWLAWRRAHGAPAEPSAHTRDSL